MEDRIEKDFTDLNFKKVDFTSGSWAWGRGGHPLKNHEWHVYHISKDFVETRYKCPEFINQMLDIRYDNGKKEAQGIMRNALGMNSAY